MTLWATTSTSVGAAGARGRPARRRSSAAGSSPARTSGRPASAAALITPVRLGCARAGAACRACARRRRGVLEQRRLERGEVLGGVDVERQRGDRDRLGRRARPRAPARVAVVAARPEGGAIASGGVMQQRVGAGAVAVGHDEHRARRASGRPASASSSSGSSSGTVAGDQQHALGAELDRRARSPAARRRCGPRRRPRPPSRRSRRRSAGRRVSAVTTSTCIDRGRAPQRDQRVGEHRLDERAARRGIELRRRGAAWPVEALDREDGDRRHGGHTLPARGQRSGTRCPGESERERERRLRDLRRRCGVSSRTSRSRVRTHASARRRRGRRSAARRRPAIPSLSSVRPAHAQNRPRSGP